MPDVREVFEMATRTVRPDPGAEERQHRRQRGHAARQKMGAYAVAAAVLIAVTVAGIVTLGGSDATKPAGGGLTARDLTGAWRTRGADAASASTLIFTPDGQFELRRASPFQPGLSGTYAVSGGTITLRGPYQCDGMQWTARLPQQGLLELTLTDAGLRIGPGARPDSCAGALGSGVQESDTFAFERVSPRSPATAGLDTGGRAEGGASPSVLGDLSGVWLADGGDSMLWIELFADDVATYLIWEGGAVDHEAGTVRLLDGSLVFRSNTYTPARHPLFGAPCDEGVTRTVWENVLISGDAFAADVPSGACGDLAPGRASWLRISGKPIHR